MGPRPQPNQTRFACATPRHYISKTGLTRFGPLDQNPESATGYLPVELGNQRSDIGYDINITACYLLKRRTVVFVI